MGIITQLLGNEGPKVSKDAKQGAERRALLDFGLGMLSQSAGGAGTNFGTALATGAMAGRASFDDYLARSAASEAEEKREAILGLGPATSDEVLQGLLSEAMRTGDNDTARTITQLLQLKATAAGKAGNLTMKEFDGHLLALDPKTGAVVAAYAPGDMGERLSEDDRKLVFQEYDNHDTRSSTLREVPQQYARVEASANALLQSYEAGDVNEDAVQLHGAALISAFARLIDPGSVVRSEEMKFLLGQGSLIDWVAQKLEGAKSGRMTKDLTEAFLKEAGLQLAAQYASFTGLTDLSKNRLDLAGIETDRLLYDDPFAQPMSRAAETAERYGWDVSRDRTGHVFDNEYSRRRDAAGNEVSGQPRDRTQLTQEQIDEKYPVVGRTP